MSGIVNSTGAKSGIIGTTVGTPAGPRTTASCKMNMSGSTPSIAEDTGFSSITDNNVGNVSFNFTTAMNNADYAFATTVEANNNGSGYDMQTSHAGMLTVNTSSVPHPYTDVYGAMIVWADQTG